MAWKYYKCKKGSGAMENVNLLSIKELDDTQYVDLDFNEYENLNKICEILSEYIIQKYEQKILYKIIYRNIEFFSSSQKKEIYTRVSKRLEIDETFYALRREMIEDKLKEYFSEENKIIINGFVIFRLNEYFSKLEEYILNEIDQYLIEKDYDEFLELIKYFVDITNPKCSFIDAYYDGSAYHIYDENHVEITDEYASDLLDSCNDVFVTPDDVFLSLLISIAPEKICIHDADRIPNKELLSTIQKVFGKRVAYVH
jgi:putative sporulation protein YtxC